MPTLSLFGAVLQLHPGLNQNLPVGPSAQAAVKLDTIARQIDIDVSGQICDVQLQLSWRGGYVDGADIALAATPAPATAVTASLLLGATPISLMSPGLALSRDVGLGLDLVDGGATAFNWFRQSLPLSFQLDTTFSETLISLDLRPSTPTATHRPSGSEGPVLTLSDQFQYDDTPLYFSADQHLPVRSLIIVGQEASLTAIPEHGVLFLHADVLDTSSSSGTDNPYLFQYGVANGLLRARLTAAAPMTFAWEALRDAKPTEPLVVLLMRDQDEHGYPLAFVPADPLTLAVRVGVSQWVVESGDAAAWNQTNVATVIANPDPTQTLQLKGTLAGLSVADLYTRFADPARPKNSFSDPWFIVGGGAPIDTGRGPLEIHGISLGSRLARGGRAPYPAKLVVEPVAGNGGAWFHRTELQIPDAGDWELHTLREERDLKHRFDTLPSPGPLPPPSPPAPPAPVGRYVQTGVRNATLTLPAIDVTYAVANLAGPGRVNSMGERPGDGRLLADAQTRLDLREKQMSGPTPTAFGVATLPSQQHVSGARVATKPTYPFKRMLDDLRVTADAVDDTARVGPALKQASKSAVRALAVRAAAPADPLASVTGLIFGGDAGDPATTAGKLATDASDRWRLADPVIGKFRKAWRSLASDSDVSALRRQMGILNRPATLTDALAPELLQAAIDFVTVSDGIDDITDDPAALADYFEDSAPEDFAEDWANPSPGLALLFEELNAPATLDLLRRIARLLRDGPHLPTYDPVRICALLLSGMKPADLLSGALDTVAAGLLQGMNEGVDLLWEEATGLWSDCLDLEALREKYGPLLTRDIYQKLLGDDASDDAMALVTALNAFLDLGLRNLAELIVEPPQYLFRTRRFRVTQGGGDEPLVSALWTQALHLAAFAASEQKTWNFFLDGDASVIVKLGVKQPLDAILKEIAANYGGPDRPDPLGILPLPRDADATDPVDWLIGDLDPELRDPDWVGVLFVRPMADISKDILLSDLVGFEHISAMWAAVGGRKPVVADAAPAIDVLAHIYREAQTEEDLATDPSTVADVKLTLIKFDVRVRQSQLSTADVVVKIEPQDVWGNAGQFKDLFIHGSLQPPSGDPSAPKDLVFAAFFAQPKQLEVGLAFIDSIKLSGLRVTRRNGVTGVDIDGVVVLRKWDAFGLGVDLGTDGQQLQLQNFRIPLPSLSVTVPVGARRKLGFDYPSIGFALPSPRAFNLLGVELIPCGLGYVRGTDADDFSRLRQDYIWLTGLELGGSQGGDRFLPCMEFDVDFGKSPGFGLVDARGLRFRMVLAVELDTPAGAPRAPKNAFLGIAGLDAKDFKIDMFGFLTLQTARLQITRARLLQDSEIPAQHPPDAGAILAEKIQFSILGWSPLPADSELDLLLLHSTQPAPQRKGMLAYYNGAVGGFFKLYWLLVAHNLALPEDALNYLLEESPGVKAPDNLFGQLIDKTVAPAPPNKVTELNLRSVQLLDRESWLFGMSFALGQLFDRCTFVLHDQHYYGIHLWGQWVKPVFGQDSIELAYIPGPTHHQDRFRTNLTLGALDFLGALKSGEVALEWGVDWDFLVDVGFPWKTGEAYNWFRAFSVPVGCYEGKLGFFFEKSANVSQGSQYLTLSAGMGLYVGYGFSAGNSIAWVRAGIGVFAILQGSVTFRAPAVVSVDAILQSSIYELQITGVIGVFAYGEGGVDVWILSARFRVSAQASLACTITYITGGPCALAYDAELEADYSASVIVGCGFCSWTFSVSGSVGMGVSGHLLLS